MSTKYIVVKDEKMEGCYGVGKIVMSNKECIAFVSETEGNGKIVAVDPATLEEKIISDKPGGGMNIVPLPNKSNDFLVIQGFYPVFKSEKAYVAWGHYTTAGIYDIREVQPFPFVHRIDVVSYHGNDYLIAANLCETKNFTDDWEHPGSVCVGKIDYKTRTIQDFHPIRSRIIKNHGFTKLGSHGEDGVIISGDCGVIKLSPPSGVHQAWSEETLIPTPASDAVVSDIDSDGMYELGVISPFHGGEFHIYKLKDNEWRSVYKLEGTHEFGHAIWGGEFNGKQAFIVGFRAAEMELYIIMKNGDSYEAELIGKNGGPANVTVIRGKEEDYICAANLEANKYTIYKQNI